MDKRTMRNEFMNMNERTNDNTYGRFFLYTFQLTIVWFLVCFFLIVFKQNK